MKHIYNNSFFFNFHTSNIKYKKDWILKHKMRKAKQYMQRNHEKYYLKI